MKNRMLEFNEFLNGTGDRGLLNENVGDIASVRASVNKVLTRDLASLKMENHLSSLIGQTIKTPKLIETLNGKPLYKGDLSPTVTIEKINKFKIVSTFENGKWKVLLGGMDLIVSGFYASSNKKGKFVAIL